MNFKSLYIYIIVTICYLQICYSKQNVNKEIVDSSKDEEFDNVSKDLIPDVLPNKKYILKEDSEIKVDPSKFNNSGNDLITINKPKETEKKSDNNSSSDSGKDKSSSSSNSNSKSSSEQKPEPKKESSSAPQTNSNPKPVSNPSPTNTNSKSDNGSNPIPDLNNNSSKSEASTKIDSSLDNADSNETSPSNNETQEPPVSSAVADDIEVPDSADSNIDNTRTADSNSPTTVNSDNNVNNTNNNDNNNGLNPLFIKVAIGIAVGGVCVVGFLVGKSKLNKMSDKDLIDNAFNDNFPSIYTKPKESETPYYKPLDNYTKTLQPVNNYASNDPVSSNNKFINPESIEPLPNLVNKVDVELPVYNITEEKYNTIGRPVDEIDAAAAAAAAASWKNNDDEITEETQLLSNSGYNKIVPEMGQMVIENTNCPTFNSSMFDGMGSFDKEIEKTNGQNENIKEIIPNIQYATVEVNNEFEDFESEDELSHDNMKQIIPDIQYATVEINNEFDEEAEDEFLNTRTNPRVVVNAGGNNDISMQTFSIYSDDDVKELSTSQDFLTIPESLKNISTTYRNAIRGNFVADSFDTLNSNESILHKLR